MKRGERRRGLKRREKRGGRGEGRRDKRKREEGGGEGRKEISRVG